MAINFDKKFKEGINSYMTEINVLSERVIFIFLILGG